MFSALLDTCVLVPSRSRDVLLEIAVRGVYRPLWSSGILGELDRTVRTLQRRRGIAAAATDAYLVRLFRQMTDAFPFAAVDGWESLVDTIELPDPDDRHVVAAAQIGGADVIVTDNLRDFPPDTVSKPLIAQSLDEFLLDSLDQYQDAVVQALHAVAGRTGRAGPAMSARGIAEYLSTRGAPGFGERLHSVLD